MTFKTNTGAAMTDTLAGVRVIEEINIDRESVYIERPGPYGGAGGFAIAGAPSASYPAGKQVKATSVVQVPTEATGDFLGFGYYFEMNYNGSVFRFVIRKIGEPFKSEQYWRQNVELSLDHYANGTVVG